MVVLEVVGRIFSVGFQNMLGVKDQIIAATRLVGRQGKMKCLEQDMEDMYWEVPKEEMLQSLTGGMDLLGKGKTELFFSLAKGGLNELDRVGTASSDHFVVITGRQEKTYVEFELFDDCFFTMGPLIMSQGTTGIPIGGFVSAQLTELWCIWREVTAMRRDCRVKTQQAFAAHCTEHFTLPATLHLADPSDFSISPDDQGMISQTDIQRSTNVPEVTHDVPVEGGFQGWYRPMEKLFGCIQLPDLTLFLVCSTPWDDSPIGRRGVLLKNCSHKQKDRVREFYSDFAPVAALLGEMLSNERVPTVQPVDTPLCLISRFRDNIYLLLCKSQRTTCHRSSRH